MPSRTTIFLLIFLSCAGAGFFVAYYYTAPEPHRPSAETPHAKRPQATTPIHRHAPSAPSSTSSPSIPTGALADERILRFSDSADYLAFLRQHGDDSFTILGSDQRLLAVRIQLQPGTRLPAIDGAEVQYQFPVAIPKPPTADAQPDAVGFGASALAWLGLSQDNSHWGKGVTVAVIDSGTQRHPALLDGVTHLTLEGIPSSSPLSNHGTAVASIISGDLAETLGVAPSADILSIRIDGASGTANTFTLAQGILAAVDAGAQIINISMGSYGHSQLVESAISYAQQNGVVIVAAAGNEGLADVLPYPAAYSGIISVGAVEANGEHLDFSNTSDSLSISAPGYGVNAAWSTNHLTTFSGTSAAAPFVSGAIAAVLSQDPSLTPEQAAHIVLTHTTDAGYPDTDSAYGNGILNLSRLMNRNTPSIYDVAITSQIYLTPTDGDAELLVTIQNLGTERIAKAPVSIESPNGILNSVIRDLVPGEIRSIRVPAPRHLSGDSFTVSSAIHIPQPETTLDNNSRTTSFEIKK